MSQSEEHVKLLSVFHYIVGGLMALFSCIPFIHLALGIWMLGEAHHPTMKGDPPPEFIGWLFIGIAAAIITLGWVLSALVIAAGRCLARRRKHLYCMIIAGIQCAFMPFGTVLGVFTLIVLMKPEVKALFAGQGGAASGC